MTSGGQNPIGPENDQEFKVSIIIPALNEAQSLVELYERIRAVMSSIATTFEFILIDDGSTDNTLTIMADLSSKYDNILVISHQRNHGKSLALMQGFNAATGDVAVTLDADLQDKPEQIPDFLAKLEEGYDLVNGWRHKRKDTAAKRFVSRVFNGLTSKLLANPVHDINCGFKAIRKTVYKNLELYGDMHRLIPALVANSGFRVGEVPVDHEDRKYGTSRYKLLRHRGLLDIIVASAVQATQIRPFHVFFEMAFILFVISIAFVAVWLGLATYYPEDFLLLRVLILLGGATFLLTALTMPMLGFFLEVMTRYHQNQAWRDSLVREVRGIRSKHG